MTFKLPKFAPSMQEGRITQWFVRPGETVAVGQPIYAIETEKTAFEMECPSSGAITPLAEAGEIYRVGTPAAEVMT